MATSNSSNASDVGAWASLMLRLAVASLFLAAAVNKFQGGKAGLEGLVQNFQKMFENTWLPKGLVTIHGYATPWCEALIVIWLVTGFRLKIGWIFTSLFLISLAFGMAVLGKGDVAAGNYTYVLIAVIGLYLSRYDRFSLDR